MQLNNVPSCNHLENNKKHMTHKTKISDYSKRITSLGNSPLQRNRGFDLPNLKCFYRRPFVFPYPTLRLHGRHHIGRIIDMFFERMRLSLHVANAGVGTYSILKDVVSSVNEILLITVSLSSAQFVCTTFLQLKWRRLGCGPAHRMARTRMLRVAKGLSAKLR